MALENATYINQLIATYPPGGDDRSTADDHLRLLKSVLQTQFANFDNVAVLATPTELNGLAGPTADRVAVFGSLGILESDAMTVAQLAQYTSTLTALRVPYMGATTLLSSAITPTELNYLSGVTSGIQAQIDTKMSAELAQFLQYNGDGSDGAVTISAATTYSKNLYNFTTLTVDVTRVLTFDRPWVILRATGAVVINGGLKANASDITAELATASAGPVSTGGSGGGGGGGYDQESSVAYSVGNIGLVPELSAITDRSSVVAGVAGAASGNGGVGTAGVAASADDKELIVAFLSEMLQRGSAGGDGGAGGDGLSSIGVLQVGPEGGVAGKGAGLIIIIAPSVTFGALSTVDLVGANGSAGAIGGLDFGGSGGGGGGSGGTLLLVTPSVTDGGVTNTFTGGAGGAGGTSSSNPGAGAAGGAGADGFSFTIDPTI